MPALADLNLRCVMNLLFTLRIKCHFEDYVLPILFKQVFKDSCSLLSHLLVNSDSRLFM